MRENIIDMPYLENLIKNEVPERNGIEYKQELKNKSEGDKKEFLADVSSFANSGGGRIFYGISEAAGLPLSLKGIDFDNEDALRLQLESSIRDGIQPRISGVEITCVKVGQGRSIVILNIPRSADAPHQVTYKGSNKFYGRNSSGKFAMDAYQVELAYKNKALAQISIEQAQQDRLKEICAGNTPVPIAYGSRIILQLIPSSTIVSGKEIDLYDPANRAIDLSPLGGGSRTSKIDIQGIYVYSQYPYQSLSPSYLRIFKNGMLETVNASILAGPSKQFNVRRVEGYLLREIREYLDYYKNTHIEPPIYLHLNFYGLQGFSLYSEKTHNLGKQPLQDDYLSLRYIVITDYNCDLEATLKIWFDALWNAFGFPYSYHYEGEGHWIYNINHIP